MDEKLFYAKHWKISLYWQIIKIMVNTTIIGREREINCLQELYVSKKPEFLALLGRRRVGKTFLVRELFKKKFVFDLACLAKSGMKT